MECGPCGDSPLCDGKDSLFFDLDYPGGPTCNWPQLVKCDGKAGERNKLMFLILYLLDYVKVFSHDTRGGRFKDYESVGLSNSNDSDAYLYSILSELEQFRDEEGGFQFMLCYPEITWGEDECVQCLETIFQSLHRL